MSQRFDFSHQFSLFLVIIVMGFCFCPLFSDAAENGGVPPQELWCVAKNNADDNGLQVALDWACGPGGADCGPIQEGGPCYDPSNVVKTASFAFNDYFLKHGLTDESCNFANKAAITTLNPSHGACKFPSSLTVSNGSFSGISSASIALGPSREISGCNEVLWGWRWLWPLISNFLLITVAHSVSGW